MAAVPEKNTQTSQTSIEDLSLGVLREEVQKWRERVPRLVASLHEKNAELERLRAQVQELSQKTTDDVSPDVDADPSVEARDHLIASLRQELQQRSDQVKGLAEKLALLETELDHERHSSSVWSKQWEFAREALDKSRETTNNLEDKVQTLEAQIAETDEVPEVSQDEMQSLRERNEILHGSLELAHQELENAGVELDELRARCVLLEGVQTRTATSHPIPDPGETLDSFTLINGVGNKTAAQLRAAGIDTLDELAEVCPEDLESPTHPLHRLRSRILSGGWIEQAVNLVAAHKRKLEFSP